MTENADTAIELRDSGTVTSNRTEVAPLHGGTRPATAAPSAWCSSITCCHCSSGCVTARSPTTPT